MKKIKIVILLIAIIIIYLFVSTNLIIKKNIYIKADLDKSYKIAFFTDTHIGNKYDERKIKRLVRIINDSDVDIVIFGGDFFDNYSKDKGDLSIETLENELSKINAKYGKFAVYGNHDFGGGATRVYYDLLSQSGFRVLKNQNIYIDELNTRIIGFEDNIFGKVNPEFYNIKSKDFNILISHEPEVINMINMENYGIMLSGHTHGGQINNPLKKQKEYLKGVYENKSINGNMTLIVSKGIGTTKMPIRIFSQPEICFINVN